MTRAASLALALLPLAVAAGTPGCPQRLQSLPDAGTVSRAREVDVAYASQPVSRQIDWVSRTPAGSWIEARRAGAAPRVLTPGLVAAGAPRSSFDGARVLFAGRVNESDHDGVFEVDAAGGEPRKVASLPDGDCSWPAYLPHDEIVFVGPAPGGTALWVAPLGGGAPPRRITFFTALTVLDPTVLTDGRILFGVRDTQADRVAAGPTTLFCVASDGTGVRAFHGQGAGDVARRRPRETFDRGVVFVAAGDGSGVLRVDARRPARAATAIAQGEFRSAEPLDGGELLVSRRESSQPGGPVPTFGVRLVLAGGAETTVADDPLRDEVDAVALVPRPTPKGHLSVVDARRSTGAAYCIDVRLDRAATPGTTAVPAALRIVEEVASRSPGGPPEAHVLGEVPIEPDGSFFVELPADRTLRLVTLGADGTPLRDSGPRLWVRPNETIGCIGCHEQPGSAPPNVQPKAVRRPAVSFADAGRGETGR